jgi:hypothetical protein
MAVSLHRGDGAPGPMRLDKWYHDTLLPDGSILLVYFGSITVGALCFSRVTADLFLPDRRRFSGGAKGKRPVATETGADFGAGGFAADRLWWRTAGLCGEVEFTPRRLGFELRCPFLASGHRSLHWVVEVPDADVRGEVRWPGGSMPVEGRGYRDRVWCDIPLWRLPIRELRWGRAVAGDHASVWVQATGPGGEVAQAWEDGHPVVGASSPPVVEPGRAFLQGRVLDLEGLRLGPLRAPLSRLLRAPHQVKTASAASIGGVEGRAVHEVVTWPR